MLLRLRPVQSAIEVALIVGMAVRVEDAPALNKISVIVKPSVPLVRIWLKNLPTFTKLLTVGGGVFFQQDCPSNLQLCFATERSIDVHYSCNVASAHSTAALYVSTIRAATGEFIGT